MPMTGENKLKEKNHTHTQKRLSAFMFSGRK